MKTVKKTGSWALWQLVMTNVKVWYWTIMRTTNWMTWTNEILRGAFLRDVNDASALNQV